MLYPALLVQCAVLVALVSGLRGTDLRSPEAKYEHEQQLRSLVAEIVREELDVMKAKQENKDLDSVGSDGIQTAVNKLHNDQATLEGRTSSLAAEVNDIKREFQTKAQGCDRPTTGISTYIRWGRTTCPVTSGAERVYKGYAAGSRYTEAGGGSNYVCLTDDPQWEYTKEEFNRGKTAYTANVWGSEYQTYGGAWPLKGDNINGGTVFDNDVPCAVCDTKGQVLMIPGTFRCPAGWQQEYHGYLMANYHGYKPFEFVCMDGHPEAVQGGSRSTDGALFYYTASKCGALPCPPYSQDREVTCVVCSK